LKKWRKNGEKNAKNIERSAGSLVLLHNRYVMVQAVDLALSRAAESAGSTIAARMAMIAITTITAQH